MANQFKVGDQLQCINKMSGNGIVVARSAKDDEVTYTVFTDFGNIIDKLSESEMNHQFEVIERDEMNEISNDPIGDWIRRRAQLTIHQQIHYNKIRHPNAFKPEQ